MRASSKGSRVLRGQGRSPAPPKSVCDIAMQLAATQDTDLQFGLTPILADVAQTVEASHAALLTITPDRGITCTAEHAPKGSPTIGSWLGSLGLDERRPIASALSECSSQPASIILPHGDWGSDQWLAANIPLADSACTSAVLVLRFPASSPIRTEYFQYCSEVLQLLAHVLQRLLFEHKRAEEQRQLATHAATGRTAIALVHDFNNVLHTIQCVTDVLLLEADSRTRDDLDQIRNAAHRGASITRYLATMGKVQKPSLECVDLEDMLTRMIPIVQRLLGPHITIRLDLPGTRLQTMTDRVALEKVLLESILNLRPRSSEPHSLGIAVRATTNGNDVGECDSTRDDKQQIALILGAGNDDGYWSVPITPESDAAAKGLVPFATAIHRNETHIQIMLSRYCPPSEPRSAVIELAPPQGVTLLLVEDEETARKAMIGILSRLGYRVLAASGQKQATDILSESAGVISALITDVILPDGSGVSLFEQLRSRGSQCKTIFISGLGPGVLHEHGLTDGDYWFLQKPHRAAELQALLQQALSAGS